MRFRQYELEAGTTEEKLRVDRRLRGEINTLTRQVMNDPALSSDEEARRILSIAQSGVSRALSSLGDALTVSEVQSIEQDGIRAVRLAQRRLQDRRGDLVSEPSPAPPPSEDDFTDEPEPDEPASPPPAVARAGRYPWGWLLGGLGVGIAATAMVRGSDD